MRVTKADKIKQYNEANPGYAITGIVKMSEERIDAYDKWGEKDLYDLYKNPSQAKEDAWNDILIDYKPRRIIGVQGSCHTYSVVLVADNGDVLHITASNNYLVEVI